MSNVVSCCDRHRLEKMRQIYNEDLESPATPEQLIKEDFFQCLTFCANQKSALTNLLPSRFVQSRCSVSTFCLFSSSFRSGMLYFIYFWFCLFIASKLHLFCYLASYDTFTTLVLLWVILLCVQIVNCEHYIFLVSGDEHYNWFLKCPKTEKKTDGSKIEFEWV